MTKTTHHIAFRANGLYEEIVTQAMQGLDIEVTVFPQGEEVIRNQLKHLNEVCIENLWIDGTVARACGSDYGSLDQIIASAYCESLGVATSVELTARLLGMVAKKFSPSKVWLVSRNIDDHPVGEKKDDRGITCWETNGSDFYAKLIEQVTGLAPVANSCFDSFIKATESEWVIVDRHAFGWVDIQGGLTLVVPPENLARSVALLGLIGQDESDAWKQAAVEKLRKKLIG